jgi:glycosyltransferase involved in cell wall biosynthesis
MRNILVYRDHLLPRSETAFMQRQYAAFTRLRPLWVGRRIDPALDRQEFPLAAAFTGAAGLAFKLTGHIPQLETLRALDTLCVHAQFGRGGAFALPLAQKLGLPLIVTFHGGDAHKNAHWRWLPIPALQRTRMAGLIDYASLFLCVSEGVRDRLITRGIPPDLLRVLPIGVPSSNTPPRTNPGDTILFIGRFVEMKGIAILVDAIRQLRAQGVTAPVMLIGDGPDRAAVTAALAGLADITLPGWQTQDQIRTALARARMLCLPSVIARSGEAEGLPSVAAEAMSLAVPVIASSDAGTAGLITNNVNGRIIPSRDPTALAQAITDLLSTPQTALTLGQAARTTVETHFNALHQSQTLEHLLLTATAGVRTR